MNNLLKILTVIFYSLIMVAGTVIGLPMFVILYMELIDSDVIYNLNALLVITALVCILLTIPIKENKLQRNILVIAGSALLVNLFVVISLNDEIDLPLLILTAIPSFLTFSYLMYRLNKKTR